MFSGEITSEKRSELENEGFPVLDKTRNLTEELAVRIQEKNKEWTDKIEEILGSEAAPRIKELTGLNIKFEFGKIPISKSVFEHLKETLVNWLKSRSEPDEPVLAYGKDVYSPNDMVKEVEDETEVGVEHVQMLLKVFENSLRTESIDEDDKDDIDDDSQGIEENDSQSRDDAEQTAWEK